MVTEQCGISKDSNGYTNSEFILYEKDRNIQKVLCVMQLISKVGDERQQRQYQPLQLNQKSQLKAAWTCQVVFFLYRVRQEARRGCLRMGGSGSVAHDYEVASETQHKHLFGACESPGCRQWVAPVVVCS